MNDTIKARPFTIDELRAYLVEIFPEFWTSGDLRLEDIAPMTRDAAPCLSSQAIAARAARSPARRCSGFATPRCSWRSGRIGPVAHAVTTSASINFLRKPAPADLIAKTRLIKLGKRLAVGEVAIYSDGESEMVAHATGTYSIPREAERFRP